MEDMVDKRILASFPEPWCCDNCVTILMYSKELADSIRFDSWCLCCGSSAKFLGSR